MTRFTSIFWAYAALALMTGLASTSASANTITMADYGGSSELVTCDPDCEGFVDVGLFVDTSLTNALNYAQVGNSNPSSELALLNSLLADFNPARPEVFGVDKTEGAGDGFFTDHQYFSIKKSTTFWFFENTSGGKIEVAVLGADYSHYTEYGPSISEVPVPAAVWLFGTALIGFIGISRRRKVA